jgi:hypothetical protein
MSEKRRVKEGLLHAPFRSSLFPFRSFSSHFLKRRRVTSDKTVVNDPTGHGWSGEKTLDHKVGDLT